MRSRFTSRACAPRSEWRAHTSARCVASATCGNETMSDAAAKPVSIRRRLLVLLIGSSMLLVTCAAVVTYFVASNSANNAYDRSLLDPAFDIADNVKLDAAGA